MGKSTLEHCPNCNREREMEWQVDFDSEPLEPQFYKICHTCGGFKYD